jgi:hypothetical protein
MEVSDSIWGNNNWKETEGTLELFWMGDKRKHPNISVKD